ncbi:MAG: 6,7-dimethyl-8-ribityllumazine synthase [Bacteroidaceae bacterium]|nr:6,7-dimethyl-8-ribityllumazine synthase [Bacteroidaceae bacterium]
MASKGFNPTSVPGETARGRKFLIVRTDWNSSITAALADSCHMALLDGGASEADIFETVVPGAFELVYASARAVEQGAWDAIIAIGCVVRGDTPHFDYICQGVTQGIAQLNTQARTPIIYGVLTVNTYAQAEDRCGGAAGDKGREFGLTAIKMAQIASS